FIRLKASAETDAIYDSSFKNAHLIAQYEAAEETVQGYDDYDVNIYGPSTRISGVETGDVILYYSEDRNIYGMIRVTGSGPEFLDGQGKANVYDKNDLILPRLKEFTSTGAGSSTAAYVDFKTGNVYTTEAEGEANVANIDVISIKGNSSGHNLYPTTNDAVAGQWYAPWGTR